MHPFFIFQSILGLLIILLAVIDSIKIGTFKGQRTMLFGGILVVVFIYILNSLTNGLLLSKGV